MSYGAFACGVKRGEMSCVVDAERADAIALDFKFVYATGVLGKAPERGLRQVEQLDQKRAVHAVMSDSEDGAVVRLRENDAQNIGAACKQVLQGLAIREAYALRRDEPGAEQVGVGRLSFLVAASLPGAIIDVVELIEDTRPELAGFSDRRGRRDAAPCGARINLCRPPAGGNPGGKRLRLPLALFGER
jgi:hypothetical protein